MATDLQFVTVEDVDAIITSALRKELFSDERGYSRAVFETVVRHASTLIAAAAEKAGYTLVAGAIDPVVATATLGAVVSIGYGRNQLRVPDTTSRLFDGLPEALRTGELPLIETEPSSFHGIAGSAAASDTGGSAGSSGRLTDRFRHRDGADCTSSGSGRVFSDLHRYR